MAGLISLARIGALPASAMVISSESDPTLLRESRKLEATFGNMLAVCTGSTGDGDDIEINAAINGLPASGY